MPRSRAAAALARRRASPTASRSSPRPSGSARSWLGPAGGPPSTQVPLRGLGGREIGAAPARWSSRAARRAACGRGSSRSVAGDLSDILASVARGAPRHARRPRRARSRPPVGARRRRAAGRGGGGRSLSAAGATSARGSGPPLVLLHPLGTDRHDVGRRCRRAGGASATWSRSTCRASATRRRSTAARRPRRPRWPPRSRRPRRRLGIDRPHVAGNSLGGWVALELGARRPRAAVTAIAPAGLWRAAAGAQARPPRRLARAPRSPALPAAAAQRAAPARRARRHGRAIPSASRPPRLGTSCAPTPSAPGFAAVNAAMRAGALQRPEPRSPCRSRSAGPSTTGSSPGRATCPRPCATSRSPGAATCRRTTTRCGRSVAAGGERWASRARALAACAAARRRGAWSQRRPPESTLDGIADLCTHSDNSASGAREVPAGAAQLRARQPHQHLPGVPAAQQVDEGLRRVLEPLDDRLAATQRPVAQPAGRPRGELAACRSAWSLTMKPRSVSRLPTVSDEVARAGRRLGRVVAARSRRTARRGRAARSAPIAASRCSPPTLSK